MKKQMGDQCYDSISTSCFMSAPTIEGLNQKPILDNNFVCSDHQTVGLALYSTCIVMTPEVGMKPQNQAKTLVFNSRSSFEMLPVVSDKGSKNWGIAFFSTDDIQRRDAVYTSSSGVCQKWGEALREFLHQRNFEQNYQLLEMIGKGHSCKVYRGRNRNNAEIVAVKVYQKRGDKRSEQAFLREIMILRTLKHSNILKIHGSFVGVGNIYAVTEYCSGGSLYNEITTKPRLTKEEQTQIIVEMTDAVEHLRQRKIVHRDIKLENIFIQKEKEGNRYILGDFGLAAELDEKSHIFKTCGTVGYTAPEILRHTQNKPMILSHKMDSFSLGVIFHIILLKRTVFQYTAGDMAQLASLNKKCYINWKQDFYSKLPKEQLELLQCTLTENPQNRFTTKQILSLPFFKNHEKQTRKKLGSLSKTISSTRPGSRDSTSISSKPLSSLSSSLSSFKNLFLPKYKRTQTLKVDSTSSNPRDNWSIISWFKPPKDRSDNSTKNSQQLQSGFVEQKKWKQKFFQKQI